MDTNELLLFTQRPEALPLYMTFRQQMLQLFPNMEIRASKTQITFRERYGFAFVSLPRRQKDQGLLVSFGLSHRVDSPRIWQVSEPYPNRWTHHVPVPSAEELDEELLAWLQEAHRFALEK